MKKEKKRELTISQLKKREGIANKIGIYFLFGALLGSIGIMIIIPLFSLITGTTFSYVYIVKRVVVTLGGFLTICIISQMFAEQYRNKIRAKSKQNRIGKMKKMAGKGNVKEKVILKDAFIENCILTGSIEKIVFKRTKSNARTYKELAGMLQIYLKNGKLVEIPYDMQCFIDSLSYVSKDELLEDIIQSIEMEKAEKETTNVVIKGQGYDYKATKLSDEDLNGIFGVKE